MLKLQNQNKTMNQLLLTGVFPPQEIEEHYAVK